MGFRDRDLAAEAFSVAWTFSIPCESWGSATILIDPGLSEPSLFQYSLRIVGFRDWNYVFDPRATNRLSVFPANRGVPRRAHGFRYVLVMWSFSIPCESWGSATRFSLRRIRSHSHFQYSLRIVGFRDQGCIDIYSPGYTTFSIPCESWGSATWRGNVKSREVTPFSIPCESWGSATCRIDSTDASRNPFQYSLRIVGFRDPKTEVFAESVFSFQYSLRIVGFRDLHMTLLSRLPRESLSVFPANRGVPRRDPTDPNSDLPYVFQYSLRIVGFRDQPF